MEAIIFLYMFFTGGIYTSWIWDTEDPFWLKLMNICFGFVFGWLFTPTLIGEAIKRIDKNHALAEQTQIESGFIVKHLTQTFIDAIKHSKQLYKEQKKSISDELEKAAEEWDESLYRSDAFKAGAQWQKAKDEFVTNDLGEYINELSKQFTEVSFAKLSRIAVRVAKWQKEQFEKTEFERPNIKVKDAIEVSSRMKYIDEDLKPIADFIMDYCSWNLHKDECNQPTIEVPLFRVLDALVQRGKPYCQDTTPAKELTFEYKRFQKQVINYETTKTSAHQGIASRLFKLKIS